MSIHTQTDTARGADMRKRRKVVVPTPEAPVGAPQVKEFTRQNPCTKLHIWNCFRGKRGFARVPVVVAHSIVGVNAPRVMRTNDRITRVTVGEVDYYQLTDDGKEWLTNGMTRYLKNHPEDASRAKNLPASLKA